MPYAINPIDGRRIYFEDDGGGGTPVVFHGGILDSVELLRTSAIARALPTDRFRRVFVDHRGLGRSDRPHDSAAYAMHLRVADAVAVLDELRIARAHFVGTSWGGRLGFGIGEHAPERVRSLVIGGQQPYAIDPNGPLTRIVGEGARSARAHGIEAFVSALENYSGVRFPDKQRVHYLKNDPAVIEAAWTAAIAEGDIASDLAAWRVPCFIFVGVDDDDFHDQARRAADEIPGAEFVSLPNADHLGAHQRQEEILPKIRRFLREHS